MKKHMDTMLNQKLWSQVYHIIKSCIMLLTALAVVYSFLYTPFVSKQIRINCHALALNQAQATVLDIQEYNANLGENQEPLQVDQIALYGTQYSLCLQSEGL